MPKFYDRNKWRQRIGLERMTRGSIISLLLVLVFASAALADEEVAFGPKPNDSAKVIGAEACAKCHQAEVQQWMRTPHFATFDSLHRKPEAKQIADRLGLKSIKRNDTCVRCHYTEQNEDGRARVVAGVSCESCHGAAADWVAIHNDYGGPNATKAAESPEHRQQRLETSVAHGMNNPRNVYLIAKQCYNCHTVPSEKLVNVGFHKAGSKDFELVAWSQGMVRHNFLRTGGSSNAESTPAQLRVMYIVGLMTDLEYSLRATAVATQKAAFGVASAERAVRMKRRLIEIQKLINDPLLEPALDTAATVELRANNGAALVEAADQVGKAAFDFAEKANGEQFSAIDPLLPTPNQYKNETGSR
jgi:Cytochrome c554 and c-prime